MSIFKQVVQRCQTSVKCGNGSQSPFKIGQLSAFEICFTWALFYLSFVHPKKKACTYVHCMHSDLSCRQCILLRIAARRGRWWHEPRREPEPKPEQHAQFSIKDTHLYFTLGKCICIYSSMDCINEQSSHSRNNYL